MNDTPHTGALPNGDVEAAAGTLTERQVEILAAAAEVFGERGYAGGSMREIASRVGVTEPALYRHFPGKRELFVTMVRVLGSRARAEAFALIAEFTPNNVRDCLIAAVDDRRRAAAHYAPVLRAILNAAISEPAVVEEFRRTVAHPVLAELDSKAAELDEAFGVADADASRAARVRALLALLVGTMATSFVLADRPDEAAADAVLRVMGWDGATGVRAPPS